MQWDTRRGGWAWCGREVATLCLLGIGIGSPLGHPRATQGPPKRGARAIRGWISLSAFVCNKVRKRPGGVALEARRLPESEGNRKPKTFNHKGHEGTQGNDSEKGLSEYRLQIESPHNRFRSQGPQVMSEPVSRILYGIAAVTVIPLGRPLLNGSSDLPGSLAHRAGTR
jgi:hypothetical protein